MAQDGKKAVLAFLVLMLIFISACNNTSADLSSSEYQESVIVNYLTNMKNKNYEAALESVYFTEKDIEGGYRDALIKTLDSVGLDYKRYEILEISKINDKIYLAKVVMNTNTNSIDKDIYVDEEFNPYLCVINKELLIVYTKDRIPSDLYDTISDIPDNYEPSI